MAVKTASKIFNKMYGKQYFVREGGGGVGGGGGW